MKAIIILAIAVLMLTISCNNPTKNTNDIYRGENMYYGIINFTYPDSIGYNDTFLINMTVPKQRYRMKGHISLYVSSLKDSVITLLSPTALKGRHQFDTSIIKDSYSRINVEFYPNQGLTQIWKFVSDSTMAFNKHLDFHVQFNAILKIDSIYLDMDTLFYPVTLGWKPLAVPTKKWYDCDFSRYSSEQAQSDNKFLRKYFHWQNGESTQFMYFYFKKN